jgi:hypothetical protein
MSLYSASDSGKVGVVEALSAGSRSTAEILPEEGRGPQKAIR